MKLVVDTNILVSFFRPNPVNELISKSNLLNLQLFSPEYVFEELKENKQSVLKYSGLNTKQFDKKIEELSKFIKVVPENFYKNSESEAEKLTHDKDIPIFALALKLNCAIWSNEPKFKQQSKLVVLSTRDMIELFS